jgi:SAM-dependent methyltransferase
VFVDVASFIRLLPGEPWIGYRQFCQMYLYPLMLLAYKGVAFHPWLRGNLDGIEPDVFRRLMSLRDVFRPGVLAHVIVHSRLQQRYSDTERDTRMDLRRAGVGKAVVEANVKRMQKLVSTLPGPVSRSPWMSYATANSYASDDSARKVAFVQAALDVHRPRLVWDLGCNTGQYARLAAAKADYVVACDADHVVIDALYAALRAEGVRNVLPLVANVASLSPDLGWRGLERSRFEARGRPDLVLCLALVHHLAIAAHLPLHEILDWLRSLGAPIVIEFVTRDDPMVRRLLRQTTASHEDYDGNVFEAALEQRFKVQERTPLQSGTRVLFRAVPS